ncbi:MAG: tryptophan--tRNA ligase [Fimbriiglobus sp.]
MPAPSRPRILSGVQPSGKLHLGNYFGAIRQHIALQDDGDAFYFIADYHALTTSKGKDQLAEHVRDVALDYLALGLDPAKATFYRQSDVPEVAELAWMLATVTPMGLLERAHSYKDKIAQGLSASVGLFTYPVLMAADILIVRADKVPVGRDQVQHLEMTRDMAGYFNRAYGTVFPEPREFLAETPVVPGTDGRKMSKSYGNTIDIFAEGKALKTAVNAVETLPIELGTPIDPDADKLFGLYKLFATAEEVEALAAQYRDPTLNADSRKGRPFGYGDAKGLLLGKIDAAFGPARERRKALAADPAAVEAVLKEGARKARAEATATMELVRQTVGMRSRPVV